MNKPISTNCPDCEFPSYQCICKPEIEEDGWSDEEWDEALCHKMKNNFCGAAGSEHCVFECPFNEDNHFLK